MLDAGLARAARTDEDVDTLIPYLGPVVDTEQDKLDFWVPLLEAGIARRSMRRLRAGAMPILSCRVTRVSAWKPRIVSSKAFSIWRRVSIEARALRRKLHDPRRPAEEQDAEAFL